MMSAPKDLTCDARNTGRFTAGHRTILKGWETRAIGRDIRKFLTPNYHCRITSLMLPERASHCTMTIGCPTSNRSKLVKKYTTSTWYTYQKNNVTRQGVTERNLVGSEDIINVPLENNSRMCRHHHWWRRVAKLQPTVGT